MARRSRSSSGSPWLIIGAAALILIFAAGFFFLSKTSDPFRTAEPLEVAAYMDNSNSLRGNVYRVEGEVLNVLAYSTTEGRLISVAVGANNDPIPMLVPASLSQVNIQKGQKFIFLIEVTDKGILQAKNLTKA